MINFICQFVDGLNKLAKKGILHRDLRPSNVLLRDGQILFSDFDSAFILNVSDYLQIRNGIEMKATTPTEIMHLASLSL